MTRRPNPAPSIAALTLALVLPALGCVITIPGSGDASASASESESASDSVADTEPIDDPDAATLAWVYQPSGCGHAYGVVDRGDQVVVAGSLDGGPWIAGIAEIDGAGALLWQQKDDRPGAYFAIDADREPATAGATLVVGGRVTTNDVQRGIVDVYTDGGAAVSAVSGLGSGGSGILGIAAIDGGYAVTGVLGGEDVLLGVVDRISGTLTLWDAPAGSGLATSVGFGVRPAASGGVAVCGRAGVGESGRAWTARFDGGGALLWESLGPDPGIGASSDCWGLALAPGGDVFTADWGYPGARLAGYAGGDGATLWEAGEPDTGTQAIDVGADGTIYVGGWSADPLADPFRSHATGARSGWLAAFDPGGALLWRAHAATPLSIYALRAGDGVVTVVGDLDPESECKRPWIGRFTL